MDLKTLPGGDLVEIGLRDLSDGRVTVPSLLVSIGSPRLRLLGFEVTRPIEDPETKLYLQLERDHGDGAHSKYNALIRRLVSFERSAGCAR